MAKLGLGAHVLMALNPKLIYASGSGFGRTGPYADKVALDLTIQAMSGVMTATGERGGRPLKAGVPVADMMSGAHLYGAIVTALFERERTGRGRVVEVSMFESMFATLLPAAGHAYVSKSPPKRTGNRHVADSYVPFDTFEASDGWIAIVCATDEHWINLTKAMGRADYQFDADLKNLKGRIDRIDEVTDAIAQWAATHTREEVVALCQAQRVPAAPLLDAVEIVQDPHLHARSFLTHHTNDRGTVALPNSPMRYEGSELLPIKAAPELGADTEAVLKELCNLGETELAALRSARVIPNN
jgi:crotonobetainyl-CoA:carnitine CoA-transferase CaiB-like acyl-CoA transferase